MNTASAASSEVRRAPHGSANTFPMQRGAEVGEVVSGRQSGKRGAPILAVAGFLLRLAVFVLILSYVSSIPARAQTDFGNTTGYAITTCGSPPIAYNPSTSSQTRPGPFSVDANGLLCVNVAAGSIALTGSTSNATSGQATSATNLPVVAYIYGFNGATWDQLQVDGSKNLKVVFGAAQTVTANQGTANATPWNENVVQWASQALGAMANYGTSPGAVLVPGVNAFVTNVPAVTVNAGTADIGNVGGRQNVTPNNCGGTVVTGGTAVNAFTASATRRGFTIANIDTSEVLWISFTTTALASDTQSYPLAPATPTTFAGASSFTSPLGFGMNTALSVVAATNGHKFSCTWW